MTASVDIRNVVRGYIQAGAEQESLDVNNANFRNVKFEVGPVKWRETTFESKGFAYSRQVDVSSTKRGVGTTVKVTPDAMPSSTISIVSGYLSGTSGMNTTVLLDLPRDLDLYHAADKQVRLDLSKHQQIVMCPSVSQQKQINGSGTVQLSSHPQVYQGTFEAVVKCSGKVMFRTQDGRTLSRPIDAMAREANQQGCLQKPFRYEPNALLWTLSGHIDLLVQEVKVIH